MKWRYFDQFLGSCAIALLFIAMVAAPAWAYDCESTLCAEGLCCVDGNCVSCAPCPVACSVGCNATAVPCSGVPTKKCDGAGNCDGCFCTDDGAGTCLCDR